MIVNPVLSGGGGAISVPMDILREWVQSLYPDFPDTATDDQVIQKALDYVDQQSPNQFKATLVDVPCTYGFCSLGEHITLQGVATVTRSNHITSAVLTFTGDVGGLQILAAPDWAQASAAESLTLTFNPAEPITRQKLADAISNITVTAEVTSLLSITLKGIDKGGKDWPADGTSRLLFSASTWAAIMGWGYTWEQLAARCGTWNEMMRMPKPPVAVS